MKRALAVLSLCLAFPAAGEEVTLPALFDRLAKARPAKAAFVERVQAEQAAFLASLRTVHSQAENRMLTRLARDRSGGTDDDADDASVKGSV